MADRPILFSAPMVRALLAGAKTQTRRIARLPDPTRPIVEMVRVAFDRQTGRPIFEMKDRQGKHVAIRDGKNTMSAQYSPPYAVSDRLYVREAWRCHYTLDDAAPRDLPPENSLVSHVADGDRATHFRSAGRFRQGMHMPKWASRITLIVTDVRVERLQEISEADAIAEGVEHDSDGWQDYQMSTTQCCTNARDSFRTLWDSLNGDRPGCAWADNPWVAAYSFDVITKNIDEVKP